MARRAGSDEDGDEDESVLVLDSSDWLVEIEWKNVSPKVIGLIAQHLPMLSAATMSMLTLHNVGRSAENYMRSS